jgi:phosphosulfolactate synthase (CoM biosynthesis protein A)
MKEFTKPAHVSDKLWNEFLVYCKYLAFEVTEKAWNGFIAIKESENEV